MKNLKRWISILFAVVITVSTPVPAAAASEEAQNSLQSTADQPEGVLTSEIIIPATDDPGTAAATETLTGYDMVPASDAPSDSDIDAAAETLTAPDMAPVSDAPVDPDADAAAETLTAPDMVPSTGAPAGSYAGDAS